jgi:pantoate--beta-alanine ligase
MTDLAVVTTIDHVRLAVAKARNQGRRIGLVPTMGALHEGHARLIEIARQECDFVVASIFVNPAQFGPNEDFAKYPRTLEADCALCQRSGAEVVFAPDAAAIYPPGFRTSVEVHGWQDLLCGASRPGHFRGVCTVVLKLFNIVQPNAAYFGQKDAQQLLIIRRMVRDLDLPLEIRAVETVREPDGLALSSRNRYLTTEERQQAPAIFRSLEQARQMIQHGERDTAAIETAIRSQLARFPALRIDYVQAVSLDTLERAKTLEGPTLIAIAAFLGKARLIDNIQIIVPPLSHDASRQIQN